ncbi:MAG TPA: phosphocholine cytidylyltransferase family protein [Polyangiaceae bacterium]
MILVAGVGQRLRPLTDDRPKALMDVGGETILGRAVRLLTEQGVSEIVLATGYREDQIRRSVEHLAVPVHLCPNPDYDRTQNSVSLALCAPALAGKSFFKLDGDVVFRSDVLARLEAANSPLRVAVDAGRELDAEAMKARVANGKILELGKGLPSSADCAETIGIEWLSPDAAARVFAAIERHVARGQTHLYYEDIYSELIGAQELEAAAVDVSDLPWSEVDTFEDLARARELLRSRPLESSA